VSLLWAVPAVASGAYWLLALAASLRHLRARERKSGFAPPVSILKPVHGRDPGFFEAIRSHAVQDYPEYEILFGVKDPSDPAIDDIRRLQSEFPERAIGLVLTARTAPNGKVAVLTELAARARHGVLVVNDSDIRVERDYLRRVVAPLEDAGAGLVTCLYRARAASFPARWEALGIATEFVPSVLVARLTGVAGFALGSTMAFRAADLARIGGFSAIEDYLADDYQLGARIARGGGRVELSKAAVETNLSGATWGEVWRHQLRWARTIRVSRTGGYYGYLATQAAFWSLLALAAGHWRIALGTAAVRMLAGWVAGRLVAGAELRWWFLMPLRDLWGFAVWMAGLAGDTVEWRGQKLRLSPDGKIARA
jgi:ceramide glucosyltransferase